MPDYQLGKFYKIKSDNTDKIYIGSTCQILSNRLSIHKTHYNAWLKNNRMFCSSFDILKCGVYKITLIEDYPCNSRNELLLRERFQIELNKDTAININKPITNNEEKKEQVKEYQKNNKDKIKDYNTVYNKEYQKNNVDKLREYRKIYYETNKEQSKEYQKNNADRIKKYNKEWYEKNKNKKIKLTA